MTAKPNQGESTMANRVFGRLIMALAVSLVSTTWASLPSLAQMREIRTTGDYRMGDNDTPGAAKQLALLDAKRKALEQVGTYLQSVTEVKNLQLSKDQIDAYSAGIIEVLEQSTQAAVEGNATVYHVNVLVRINTADMVHRLDMVRNNQATSTDLLEMRKQVQAMQQQLEQQNKLLATLTAKPDVDRATQQRQETMANVDAKQLLSQAWVALAGADGAVLSVGSSSVEGRQRARQLVEQALKAEPDNADAHYKLGIVLLEEGQASLAEREFREGLRRTPSASGRNRLGNALKDQGKLADAVAEYREAIRLNPNYAIAHNNLGGALGDQGKSADAIAEYREAIRLNPNYYNAHYGLGANLRTTGDRAGAAREFREYLRLAPNTPQEREWIDRAKAFIKELELR